MTVRSGATQYNPYHDTCMGGHVVLIDGPEINDIIG